MSSNNYTVYQHKNKINNKSYIGITSRPCPNCEVMKEELVMTKDIFIACYNKWIKEEEN